MFDEAVPIKLDKSPYGRSIPAWGFPEPQPWRPAADMTQ
jgi:hypothetical protein